MNIEIKKAKIKSKIFLAYEYKQTIEGTQNDISTSSNAPIHPDLQEKFNALIPHFALLTEQIGEFIMEKVVRENNESEKEELVERFNVTGITISDSNGEEGVVLTGQKILKNGKVVNFNTPFTKYYDDMESYEYGEELQKTVADLKEEVLEYMNGKQAESNQLEMFGDDEEFEPEETTGGETKEFKVHEVA